MRTCACGFSGCYRWSGELHGRELQQFTWQSIRHITVSPVLPANGPILRGLALPAVYGITHAGDLGRDAFMRALAQSLDHGLRLIQVREKQMTDAELSGFAAEVVAAAHAHDARVVVNGGADVAKQAGADGVHLTVHLPDGGSDAARLRMVRRVVPQRR